MSDILETPLDVFYRNKLYFSYSSLKKLMWNPKEWYNYYVLNKKEDVISDNLLNGKIIHCLLLNNEKFNDEFIVSSINIPTGNNKLIVDKIFYYHSELLQNEDGFGEMLRVDFKLSNYSNAILNILKEINLHQSLKTDQQRLDKILTEENINYFEFLKNKKNKYVIDLERYNFCLNSANVLKQSDKIMTLLGMDSTSCLDSSIEVINEKEFKIDLNNQVFGLKGILDNLVINHEKKEININDLKNTSKELTEFKESVEFYMYWLQAIIYILIVTGNYKELVYEKKYKVNFNFIVLNDKAQYHVFNVSENTLNVWYERFKKILLKAEYHYTNRDYNLPYDLANNLISL